ncbi:hypothetical protein APF79_01220 [bacterium BRH_c32]|nr:MAG: hypothetical protein APF79_01220 [bacterium BRH_c32]
MFEREIKFIYDFNLNKVNKLGPYFTFEELQNSGIHPAILHYISAEIDFLIFDDRQKLLKNSVFDYSGENINSLFIKINEEIKKSKRFSLDYISKLILRSISFTINFLVRPKWTLNKFIFDDYDHKTAVEVKQILNYIYYYKYLNKILIAYIDTKKLLSINSVEFAQITNKIERLGIETYLNVIINDALKAMGEFFNIGEIQKNKVPITAFKYFLSEKELGVHINKIDENFPKEESSKVSIPELKKVLDKIEPYKIYEQEATLFDEPKEKEEESTIESVDEFLQDNEPPLNFNLNFNINKELLEDPKLDIEHDSEEAAGLEEVTTEEDIIENYEDDEIKKDLSESILDESVEEESENEDLKVSNLEAVDLENGTLSGIAMDSEDEALIDDVMDIDNDEDFNEESSDDELEEEINHKFMVEEKDRDENFILEDNEIDEKLISEDDDSPNPIDFNDELEKYIPDEIKVENDIDVYRNQDYQTGEHDEDDADELKDESESEEELEDETKEVENDIEGYNSIFNPSELNKVESHVEIDIAELLEHKNMTKVIEVIFDYDVEEFTNTIEEVCKCRNLDDALLVLNEKIKQHYSDVNSKEANQFREIITEYYNKAD